jgi:hypothetical protein
MKKFLREKVMGEKIGGKCFGKIKKMGAGDKNVSWVNNIFHKHFHQK